MTRFAQQVSRSEEPVASHDGGLGTRFAVHGPRTLGMGFQDLVAARLAAALRGESRVERVVVRFEDLNGPKGGEDTACRIQVALSGLPVIVVEARAEGEAQAFRLALPKLNAALHRQLDRRRAKPRTTLRLLHTAPGREISR
jgi:hypothetical protein